MPCSLESNPSLRLRNHALGELPAFPEEFDVRPFVHTGFVDEADFFNFTQMIPDEESWLEAMCTAAFVFGFRKSELVYMRCSQIDLEHGESFLRLAQRKTRCRGK
jgi:hypothetical protein